MILDDETLANLGFAGGWEDQTHALLMQQSEEAADHRERSKTYRAVNPAALVKDRERLRALPDSPEKSAERVRSFRESNPERAREIDRESKRRRRAGLAASGIRTRADVGLEDS